MAALVSIVLKIKPFQHEKQVICDMLTCSKLLNSHEWETNKWEGFPQNLLFILSGQGKLLSVTLGLCPTYHRPKQTVLPDAECVSF